MKIFYSDIFVLPLPPGHRFPMQKYAMLRQRVIDAHLVAPMNLSIPHAASDTELLRVHDANYLQRCKQGLLTTQEMRRIGFPWSPEMVERSRRSAGATIEACRAALMDGFAVNLAGGTHHAYRDHGEGYCVFNDSAIAAHAVQAEHRARRILIIDCDVHQGNGTAAILADDESIFTFSIHGAKNYPFNKEHSDLDRELADQTSDDEYLAALDDGLCQAIELSRADLAIYLAGADPYADDRLGRLALSKAGLAARDRMVFEYCHASGIPVVVTMAGGYARDVNDTVDIHFQTVKMAAQWR